MTKLIKFCISLIFTAIIFFGGANCSAENLKFIDSNEDIGYFVDLDSLKIESSDVFTVNLMIIRANINQMEIVDLRINHRAKTYEIRSVNTVSYDERTILKTDSTPRTARSYAPKSLMGEIVRIILYNED